jgi:uncharacterized protein DUF4082
VTDYDLYGATSGPATSENEPGSQYTLGVEWYATSTSWLKGYRIWRPSDGGTPQLNGPIVARTWTAAGSVVGGTDAAFTLSGSGWQTVLLGTPIALSLGSANSYRSGAHFPGGRYSATTGYFGIGGAGEGGIINGPLRAPDAANSIDLTQNLFTLGAAISFPASGSSTNYWVQPIITDVDPGGESNSGDVTSNLALGSSATGSKTGVGTPTSNLGLNSSAAGLKLGAGGVGSALSLGSALGAGSKTGAGAVSSTLALASSVTGVAVSDGKAARSQVLCSPWALPNDVPEPERSKQSDAEWMRDLTEASEILYYLSGRRWIGLGCTETATLRSVDGNGTWPYHPSWGSCPCWSYGTWEGLWLYPPGVNVRLGHYQGPVAIQLPMSPIGTVTEVLEDGVLLSAATYRVSRSGWVTRIDGRSWNTCMDTTTITYTFGEPPPEGGVRSAVDLAVERLAWRLGEECAWPRTVTSVTRQGLSMEIANPLDFISDGRTGLPGVDMWLAAVNPTARAQRGRVWSPDIPAAHR